MIKSRKCEEVVKLDGKTFVFSGTFGNIQPYSFLFGDPGKRYNRLSDNELPPSEIKGLIENTLYKIEGVEIKDEEKEAIAKSFIEDAGLQDCAYLCRHLLSHAIIGNVKKKQLERKEVAKKTAQSMTRKIKILALMSFGKVGLLWGVTLISFLIFACMTFRYT